MRSFTLAGIVLIATSIVVPIKTKANEQLFISVCGYVKANDKSKLRKKLKEGRVSLRNIYADLRCNGQNLLQTAYGSSANEVGEFIVKRVSSKAIKSSNIYEWANSNGHTASPITNALKSKLKL